MCTSDITTEREKILLVTFDCHTRLIKVESSNKINDFYWKYLVMLLGLILKGLNIKKDLKLIIFYLRYFLL